MKIGIGYPSCAETWQVAERAEALGFNSLWLWDSPLVCGDPFAALAASAVKTSTIRLGTGVYVPANRDPSVTASGFATINALAPGRVDLCAGTGNTARRAYDQMPMTRKAFRAHMESARALLEGDETMLGDPGRERIVRLLHGDRGLIDVETPIRWHVAAAGPKMMQLAAELGMHWVNAQGPFGTAADSAAGMEKAWADAGRAPETLRKTIMTAGCLLRDGETFDSQRVRDVGGGMAASIFHIWIDAEQKLGQSLEGLIPQSLLGPMESYRKLFAGYDRERDHLAMNRGHCMFMRPDEEDIITGDVIDQLTLSGDAETMRTKLAQFEEAGTDELIIAITHGQEDCLEDWAAYFELETRESAKGDRR